MLVAYSVRNQSDQWIEVLPPQIEVSSPGDKSDTRKKDKKRMVEAEQIPVKDFRVNARPCGRSRWKDKTGTMLVVAGAILVILVAFFGFISTKGTNKKKDAQDSPGKPNLGRVVTPSAPGQLVPADKVAVESATAKTSSQDANDIEKTKSLKAGTFGVPATSSSPPHAGFNRSLSSERAAFFPTILSAASRIAMHRLLRAPLEPVRPK